MAENIPCIQILKKQKQFPSLKKNTYFYLFFHDGYVPLLYGNVYTGVLVTVEARTGPWVPWNWSPR